MRSFKEKLERQFKTLSISVLNEPKYMKHLHADYVELVSLFSNDFISQNEIIDRLIDNGITFKINEIPDGEMGSYDTEKQDTAEAWINSIFEYLQERAEIYLNSYPFLYDKNKGIKLRDKRSITEARRMYLFLLIASSLIFFGKLQSELTSDFEILAECALKSFLPQHAKVYGFGSNSHFKGNAQDKIMHLAKEINVSVNERVISQISKNNSKEEGLDIVGWIPFKDNNPNTIIILCQCACGKDWFGKQNETRRYDRFYDPYLIPFTHAIFLPGDFNNKNGIFELDKELTFGQLVFERRRLIDLSYPETLSELKFTNTIIERCFVHVEDIV